jgi:hypothetical protein
MKLNGQDKKFLGLNPLALNLSWAETHQPDSKWTIPRLQTTDRQHRPETYSLKPYGQTDKNSQSLNLSALNISGAETYHPETKRALPIKTKTPVD